MPGYDDRRVPQYSSYYNTYGPTAATAVKPMPTAEQKDGIETTDVESIAKYIELDGDDVSAPVLEKNTSLTDKIKGMYKSESKNNSVVQDWVSSLSWKMQTTLFCSLRGPDFGANPELKLMVRWLRSTVLKNADKDARFMKDVSFKTIDEICDLYPSCVDMLTIHFFSHILNSFGIIGYFHPDANARDKSKSVYIDLCNYLHLSVESKGNMAKRLSDNI